MIKVTKPTKNKLAEYADRMKAAQAKLKERVNKK